MAQSTHCHQEAERGDTDVLRTDNTSHMQVLEPKTKVDLTKFTEEHDFFFDEVLDETATNQQVYARCGSPLVRYVLEKHGKATCFAYGQTGSGKTPSLPPSLSLSLPSSLSHMGSNVQGRRTL